MRGHRTGVLRPGSQARELAVRCASAAALAPAAAAAAFSGGLPLAIFVCAAAVLAAAEWLRLCQPDAGRARLLAAGVPVAAAALAGMAGGPAAGYAAALAAAAMLYPVLASPGRSGSLCGSAGTAYAGVFAVALISLSRLPGEAVPWLFAVVWAADTGAFATGRIVKGPRLAPTVSPGKTWSGLAGAVLSAAAAGYACAGWAGHGTVICAAAAGALGFVGQGGDLAESALKRRAGVKDSGRTIPGHGGVLDRLDALMAAAPCLLALLLALPSRL